MSQYAVLLQLTVGTLQAQRLKRELQVAQERMSALEAARAREATEIRALHSDKEKLNDRINYLAQRAATRILKIVVGN